MTLYAALEKIQEKVNYPKEYFIILRGNVWELQYFKQGQIISTETHPTDLKLVIIKTLKNIK